MIEFNNGYIKYNNMKVIEVTETSSKIEVDITEDSLNPYGYVHGGLLFGTADTGMGIICSYDLKPAVTVSSSIEYLKPATGKKIICISELIRKGKTICNCESKIYNEKNELVTIVQGTYYYIDK